MTVEIPQGHDALAVTGSGDRNLKLIREALGVHVASRDGLIVVSGDAGNARAARAVLERLRARPSAAPIAPREEVLDLITEELRRAERSGHSERRQGRATGRPEDWDGTIHVRANGVSVRPRTAGQSAYLDAIRDNDCVFGVGPAGTGKTYIAVAAAIQLLRDHRVQKVILCRPAVEAGEKLGFLPGDLEAKVNPYLRPLLDALHDMMSYTDLRRLIDNDVVEVVPLAFMRGRTLNNAVIILDEAQNTTVSQMQMFLTRMGHGSKVIVTGDPTQIDLPDPTQSGLIDAVHRLRRVKGLASVTLTGADVVRHHLVQRIVEAYGGDPLGSQRPVRRRAAEENQADRTGD